MVIARVFARFLGEEKRVLAASIFQAAVDFSQRMPYVLISTLIRLECGPTLVGDQWSDTELMEYLGAKLVHEFGNNFKEYRSAEPPRIILNKLEQRGYRVVAMTGKYPQIKKLMVVDTQFKYIVVSLVILQFIAAYFVGKYANWMAVFVMAYCFAGVINHALLLAIHEIAHNAGFGHSKPWHNRILGMIANLPIGVPCTFSFKKYHLEHHRYQGHEVLDVDLPSEMETKLFTNTFTKFFWVILQPFFYTIRPLFVNPKPPQPMELFNFVTQFMVDVLIVYIFGAKALVYLVAGSLLGMGLHPVAGHFISEHYMFKKGFETYSYYGPLNMVTFNVGYHNEHHDFPSIPGSLLPKVREIAPEYYNTLPHHTSWVKVLYDFITDPDIGPYARVKRKQAMDKVKNAQKAVSEQNTE